MRNNSSKLKLARRLELYATLFSIIVLGLVVGMRYISFDMPFNVMILPPFHAIVNSLTAICLIAAFVNIKTGRVEKHKAFNLIALGLSAIFLVSYVIYHISTEPTSYGGEGTIKYVYYFLLATHVFLAAASLPFILFTFIRGYTDQFERHKRMARWVFPVWLYVALTGPICYFMLAPYY